MQAQELSRQTTSHLLMIRPVAFTYNAETAVNNAFQQQGKDRDAQQKAVQEFDQFVQKLSAAGMDVTVVQDTPLPHTPDSVFPNNWISFHSNGMIVLYPMYAANRRAERKAHVVAAIAGKFSLTKYLDFSAAEQDNRFLEGTGSMVLDRSNRIAYACISPRTDKSLFEKWCASMQYTPCSFHSVDEKGGEIYHTNVMMCVADTYVVICLDSIRDDAERTFVATTITGSGKKIVDISFNQINRFAGNMLQVENRQGTKYLVMSSQAYASLNQDQVEVLESFNPILHSDLNTIETNGGGSARCMIAEVFLPIKTN